MNIGIIGAGISGMAAGIDLAADGHKVDIFEKNGSYGGRGQLWSVDNFHFDMGPSWYWMADVFEKFFNKHGKSASDYYDLIRLDPSYKMVFSDSEMSLPAKMEGIFDLFEATEKGSGRFLKEFLTKSKRKYEIGMGKFVHKPGLSIFEYLEPEVLKNMFSIDLFTSMEKAVNKQIKDERLRKLLWFPVLFLGAKPKDTPALYSLMNYADMELGTWFPKGGMIKLFQAMYDLAIEKGVKFHFNQEVKSIDIQQQRINTLHTNEFSYACDAIVGTGDYHHIDQNVLPDGYQYLSQSQWAEKVMSPSSLLMYLGINRKLPRLEHHTLFFDSNFEDHMSAIYDEPSWPEEPLFYACTSTKTDENLAPAGKENLFVLIPLAPNLEDNLLERERLYAQIIQRLEKYTGVEIANHVEVKRLFGPDDFAKTYFAFKSNAYGMANTLWQTAFLRPPIQHPRIINMYYAGQLTNPGPGLPPSLISGQIAASLIRNKNYN